MRLWFSLFESTASPFREMKNDAEFTFFVCRLLVEKSTTGRTQPSQHRRHRSIGRCSCFQRLQTPFTTAHIRGTFDHCCCRKWSSPCTNSSVRANKPLQSGSHRPLNDVSVKQTTHTDRLPKQHCKIGVFSVSFDITNSLIDKLHLG